MPSIHRNAQVLRKRMPIGYPKKIAQFCALPSHCDVTLW